MANLSFSSTMVKFSQRWKTLHAVNFPTIESSSPNTFFCDLSPQLKVKKMTVYVRAKQENPYRAWSTQGLRNQLQPPHVSLGQQQKTIHRVSLGTALSEDGCQYTSREQKHQSQVQLTFFIF